MDKVLLIGFLLLPYVVLSGGIIHMGQRHALFLAGNFVLAGMVRNRWIRYFGWYWGLWLIFILWGEVNAFVGRDFAASAFTATAFFMVALALFVAVQNSRSDIRLFYDIICIAAIAQTLLAISQLWGYDPFFRFLQLIYFAKRKLAPTTPTGSLGNNNFLAIYLAISLPFFFRKYWAYFVPVLMAMILCSITATAVVAAMAGGVIYFYRKTRFRWLGLGTVPFVIYLMIYKQSLTIHFTLKHDRFQWWALAIKKATQTIPGTLFGMGPAASWGRSFPLHNEWVTSFYMFGVIGLGFLLFYIFTIYRGNRRLLAAIVAASVAALGSYPIHLAPSLFLILIIAGLIEREKIQEGRSNIP